ncbi:MAG: ATP-binding cassette domain-containing protein [Fimbriimonadaceae bacterium]|nr:ATP-binding cassette domain-containing protein [Fimbriimonadaceae bacterium]
MIRAEGASLVFQDHGRAVAACREISMEVRPGEFLGILGPSGSGKSSLLYLLSGLRVPTAGRILYQDRPLESLSDEERARIRLREFGFVFQLPHLLGYLTSVENVVVANPSPDAEEEAVRLLTEIGLGDHLHRRPHELSGGQRQRVCVARALAGGRRIIFADEPTAALDHHSGLRVVQQLARHRGEGALVMVTHDPSMLEEADRILHLADGQIEREELRSPSKIEAP